MNLRSLLYCSARLLGDVHAVTTGRIAQRIVRKAAYRSVFGLLRRLLP